MQVRGGQHFFNDTKLQKLQTKLYGFIKHRNTNRCVFPDFYCESALPFSTEESCNKTEERKWLKEFYFSTNGDNWTINTNWLNDSLDYCEW